MPRPDDEDQVRWLEQFRTQPFTNEQGVSAMIEPEGWTDRSVDLFERVYEWIHNLVGLPRRLWQVWHEERLRSRRAYEEE